VIGQGGRKMTNQLTGRLILVEWFDHWSGHGWASAGDYHHKPIHIRTIGWEAESDDERILLLCTSNRIGTNRADYFMGILYTDIVKFEEIILK